jgi:hypothetical protein
MPALQEFHHSTLYLIRAEIAVTNFCKSLLLGNFSPRRTGLVSDYFRSE